MSDPLRDESFAARVLSAQADLQEGIDRGGLRNDPFRHPLQALSSVIGLFPEFTGRLSSALEQARQPIDPAAVERIEHAAAIGANQRAAEMARAHTWRTLAIYGGVSLGGALVAAWVGYAWGWESGSESVRSTERRLALAYQDGPAAAAAWSTLMENNDIVRALGQCVGPRAYADTSGRKACLLPIYIEPPHRGPPFEAPH